MIASQVVNSAAYGPWLVSAMVWMDAASLGGENRTIIWALSGKVQKSPDWCASDEAPISAIIVPDSRWAT
jgi:hypothetical protein